MTKMITVYLIEINRPEPDELEFLAERVTDFNSRDACIMPVVSSLSEEKMRFVAVRSGAMEEERFRERIGELVGVECEIRELNPADITKENSALIASTKSLLPYQYIRGEKLTRMQRRTVEDIENEINALPGFTEFKQAIAGIKNYISNIKRVGGRANYNIVFIDDCNSDVNYLTELVYDYYFANGLILDPIIGIGDLDDAARSERNTTFLYKIEEEWQEANGNLRHSTEYEKMFKRMQKRKTIYVTSMTKKQHEAAKAGTFQTLFPSAIFLSEPTIEEKLECLNREVESYGFTLNADGFTKSEFMKGSLDSIYSAASIVVKEKLTSAVADLTICVSDFNNCKPGKKREKSPFDELEALIGLAGVKSTIREISTYIKNRGRDSLPCLHMVFRGNPGTGKTTVARIIGKIFAEIGALQKRDVFVEADRNKLVSIYLGGTADQTTSVVKSALGGVLFIDEAYSLCNGEKYDYGNEAVAALVKLMEDHRSEFVCIMAGYTKEMNEMLNMNPGLRERVQFYIDFPDYDASELVEIFEGLCRQNKYRLSPAAKSVAADSFMKIVSHKDVNFANGRVARKVFERVKFKQAMRGKSDSITKSDVELAFADADLKSLCGKNEKPAIGFQLAG